MAFLEALEPDRGQDACDPLIQLARCHLGDAQAEGDVLEDRHVRPHCIVLEHHAHASQLGHHHGIGRRQQLASYTDAAAIGPQEARQHAQHGGLAAARRAQKGDELPLVDAQRDVAQGLEAAEALVDPSDVDEGHGAHLPPGAGTGTGASAAAQLEPDSQLTNAVSASTTAMVNTASADTTSSWPRSFRR